MPEKDRLPAKRRRAGHPLKLDDKLHNKIIQYISEGHYFEQAAAMAGITRQTYYNWIRRGENLQEEYEETGKVGNEEEERLRHFFLEAQKAIATAEDVWIRHIKDARHWTAKAWLLERRFPDRWGLKERTEITGPEGKPLQIETSSILKPEVQIQMNEILKEITKDRRPGHSDNIIDAEVVDEEDES